MLTTRLPPRMFRMEKEERKMKDGEGGVVYVLNPRNHPRLFNPSLYKMRKINKNL